MLKFWFSFNFERLSNEIKNKPNADDTERNYFNDGIKDNQRYIKKNTLNTTNSKSGFNHKQIKDIDVWNK